MAQRWSAMNREVLLLLYSTNYQPIGSYVGVSQSSKLNKTQRRLSTAALQLYKVVFYSVDISIPRYESQVRATFSLHFKKQKKSSVT